MPDMTAPTFANLPHEATCEMVLWSGPREGPPVCNCERGRVLAYVRELEQYREFADMRADEMEARLATATARADALAAELDMVRSGYNSLAAQAVALRESLMEILVWPIIDPDTGNIAEAEWEDRVRNARETVANVAAVAAARDARVRDEATRAERERVVPLIHDLAHDYFSTIDCVEGRDAFCAALADELEKEPDS
jgi:hypothetical protein